MGIVAVATIRMGGGVNTLFSPQRKKVCPEDLGAFTSSKRARSLRPPGLGTERVSRNEKTYAKTKMKEKSKPLTPKKRGAGHGTVTRPKMDGVVPEKMGRPASFLKGMSAGCNDFCIREEREDVSRWGATASG